MTESLQALDRRIHTAKTVRSLVRTMKNLAAASIRHYDEAAAALDDYAGSVELGFQAVLADGWRETASAGSHPALVGAMVFGSGQGLAGRFNERIATYAADRLGETAPAPSIVAAVGPYVGRRLETARVSPARVLPLPASVAAITAAVGELLEVLEAWRRERGVDRVLLFHNVTADGAAFAPRSTRLLPLDPGWLGELAARPWPGRGLPAYRTGREPLFSALVREHLFISCYRAFAQSLASEQGSRLEAMQLAQRNLDERLEELQQRYSRRRQTAITEELFDLMTAVEALRGESGDGWRGDLG